MRALLVALLLTACGGPSRNQLAETPTAKTPRTQSLAPPANDNDKDRYKVNESFEDQRDAKQAYGEAGAESNAPPPAPLPQEGSGSAAPKKN